MIVPLQKRISWEIINLGRPMICYVRESFCIRRLCRGMLRPERPLLRIINVVNPRPSPWTKTPLSVLVQSWCFFTNDQNYYERPQQRKWWFSGEIEFSIRTSYASASIKLLGAGLTSETCLSVFSSSLTAVGTSWEQLKVFLRFRWFRWFKMIANDTRNLVD